MLSFKFTKYISLSFPSPSPPRNIRSGSSAAEEEEEEVKVTEVSERFNRFSTGGNGHAYGVPCILYAKLHDAPQTCDLQKYVRLLNYAVTPVRHDACPFEDMLMGSTVSRLDGHGNTGVNGAQCYALLLSAVLFGIHL